MNMFLFERELGVSCQRAQRGTKEAWSQEKARAGKRMPASYSHLRARGRYERLCSVLMPNTETQSMARVGLYSDI